MKQTGKQICSLLLMVCMVFTMLPTAVFAEEGSQNSGTPLSTSKTKQLATNLRVKGLPTIAAGQPLPTSIEGITVSNCTVTGLSWTEAVSGNFGGNRKNRLEDYYNYTFIPGRTYMIKIAITANEGYELNTQSIIGEVSTVQSVDGELVDSDKSVVAYDSQETKKHTIWYLYTTLPEDEENKISKLTFTCQEPIIGQALCGKNAIAVTDCDVSNTLWRKDNIATSDGMCDGAGKYELQIVCLPKEGKYFAKDLTATINNNKITVIGNIQAYGYYNTYLKYTFTVTEANVNAIVPTITAHPADANYTVGDTATVLTTGANIGDGGTLSYQWYSNAINSNNGGAEISGERTEIYTPPTDTARTTYYYCVVTNTNNSATGNTTATATSNTAKIIVTNDDSYSITVHNGTANLLTAAANESVTITANTAPSGQRFKEWTVVSGGVTLANAKTLTTTFTMPANAVVVMATYESISVSGINITDKFTDVNFLAEVRKALKKDANFPILDTYDFAAVTSLSISNKGIKSLAGIEYFTALTTLNCSRNQLTALDVSNNTALGYLYCGDNQLSTLNVSKNTALTYLSCEGNQLSALDVSKNTVLIELHCYDNQLSTLDVSKNTAFTKLNCSRNQLTTLDVSKNTALTYLSCNENQLSALNVSNNTALGYLSCNENQLSALNVSNNTALGYLSCDGNQLSTLDVSKNTILRTLDCSGNYMANKSAVNGLDTSRTTTFTFDPQKTSTSTYSITVNSGTANPSTAAEGATVTITASTPDNGKRFKEWTVVSGGVTLANAKTLSTTFTMPANAVVVTATYENISASGTSVTGVTLNKSNLYLYSNTTPNTATLTATVSPSNATDKSVTWQSSNTAVATVDTSGNVKAVQNGTANITVTTTDDGHIASCTVTVSTYTSGGGSSSGGGGSSSGGSTSTPTLTTPPTTTENSKPATEVTATVKPTVSNGTVTAAISNETVNSAIAKAQAENKKNETESNGIVVEINVDIKNTTAKNLTANLPKSSVDTLVKAGTNELRITSEIADINLNLRTLKEIQKQVGVDVNVTAKKVNNNTLSAEAKKAVGNRPVYDFSITGTNGKKVTNFGNGSVSVSVPYTLGKNEIAANVVAYYIDSQGKVIEMPNSVYDPFTKTLRFVTEHFSKFAVGYKTTSIAFTDITNHWAKKSIEFVSARGLLAGTGNDKFSPNVSMTRGIFVTALGRLAEANVASYTTSVFTDVKANAYYMPYVEWASKNDIVNGTSTTTFAPDQSITREQMAVIIANYAKVIDFELPKVYAENTFADGANISTQAKDAVKQMQMAGILAGKNDNKFDPQGTATRAEVSALLKRFVELAISADTAEGWAMNDSGKWMYYENGKAVTGKKAIDGTNYTFDQYGVTADVPKNRKYNTYIVQKGDSFWLIAYKQGCTMKKLEQLNNKSRFSLIHPGDELIVPEK